MIAPRNRLLAALPPSEYQRLNIHLKPVSLKRGQILYHVEEEITTVYFPEQALVSLVLITQNGNTCDAGIIGSEGMVGLPVIFGSRYGEANATLQFSGTAQQLSVEVLRSALKRREVLQQKLLEFAQILQLQMMQTIMYNTLRPVETRLARWLLLAQSSMQRDELPFTQELLSEMLGVRRATISEIASAWGRQGIIAYHRGKILIKKQQVLVEKAGEDCRNYQTKVEQYLEKLALHYYIA
ncbi:MAG: Crp/Fnr family transcriptional regulator [Cyanophyceae cyanobacterium]